MAGQNPTVQEKTILKTRDIAYIGLFVALMAICSWISVPMTIPFTLQTFAVFLAIGVLGGKRGTIAVVVYLLIGAVGIPVFSGMRGGPAVLFGLSGGYIIGFLFTALVMWGITAAFGDKIFMLYLASIVGLLVCYAFGTAWFAYLSYGRIGGEEILSSLSLCVFPFIVPDLCKIGIAMILTDRLRKALRDRL